MKKRYKVKVADTEREYVAKNFAEAEKQFKADFGDMSGRPIIWTETNFFRVTAEGDAIYYAAYDMPAAQAAFKQVYGEVPADAVKWEQVKETDIPDGEEFLPAYPL